MLLHPQIRFDPTVVTKGDFVGHPFRGNQWSDNKVTDIVGPRTANEIVTRADLVKFAEMPPAFIGDKELFTHATMSNADIPAILREGIKPKYETVYSSRPPLVRELSGTYVIFKADKGVAVKGTDIVEIGLSYDEYTFTGTIPPADIVKVVEIYVYNAGGQSVREDQLAKFILENPNDPQINDLPEKYKRWATLASDVTKGDFMGHPFRGNQWSDASGATTGGSNGSSADTNNKVAGSKPPALDRDYTKEVQRGHDAMVAEAKVATEEVEGLHGAEGALYQYQSDGYKTINATARAMDAGERRTVNAQSKRDVEALDEAIAAVSMDALSIAADYEGEPIDVFRGVTNIETIKLGDTLTNDGFTSTTLDPLMAMMFSKSAGGVFGMPKKSLPVLRIMGAKKGLPIQGEEREILLQRNLKLKVVGRSQVEYGDGIIETIDCEIIK